MWAGGLRRIDEFVHALTWWNRFEYIWTAVAKQRLADFIPVEIGLRLLADETAQWPDKWTLYLHGIHDENPHVWVDAPPQVWTYPGSRITINDGTKICACGAIHPKTLVTMLNSLINRDVQ